MMVLATAKSDIAGPSPRHALALTISVMWRNRVDGAYL